MGSSVDRERQARAALAYLFEPGPRLHELTAADGPVAAWRTLRRTAQPPDGIRGELARPPATHLWAAASEAAPTARAHGRVVVPGDPDWPPPQADLATTTPDDGGDVSAV